MTRHIDHITPTPLSKLLGGVGVYRLLHDCADRPTCVQIADYQESTLMYQEDTVYDDAAQGQYVKASKTVRGDNVAASMTSVEYADALGRVVRSGAVIGGAERLDVVTYDPQGNRLTFLSARDAARGMPYSGKWEYDFAGRVVREYAPRASASTAEVYALTEYDALGNTVRTVDFRGNAMRYTHDALGRVIRQETDFEDSTPAMTEFVYDAAGNVTEQRVQANKPGEAVKWRRTTNTYDERGRVTDTVVYTGTGADDYDHTHYTYDERNNRTGVYTGVRNGVLGGAQLTRYEYDHFDHVTRIIDPTGRSEYFFYDETGRLLNTQDKNHHAIVYGYDALDRVLQEVAFDLPTMTQELKVLKRYALTGALRYDQNPNQSFNYYYDETGRLAREVETNGATKTFTYDYSGARTGMALQRGAETILNLGYTYDHAGRLQTVRRDGVTVAEYAYDANGNRESLTYTGTGMVTSYAYNKANLVTSLVNRKGSDNSSQFTYTYFLDGNQAGKAEPGKTTSYTYDLAGRLLQETAGAQTLAYTYDRFGNRATLTASGAEAYTTTYTYDSRNQLTRSSEVRGGVATVTDYGYDAVGNELFRARNGAVASTVDMEYNNYNQLVKVTKDGVATTYTYRPDGLRLSKTVAGVMTRHIWDGEQIIAELNSNGTTKSRFLRGVNLIAQQIDSQTQYYLFNAHGDVVQKTSSNGTVLKNYSYDAFGVESNMEALDGNPFRYCGEYFDKESDTYYLRARYYNPRTGRFGAEDPAKDGLNWYTYCGNNPVLFVDPEGMAPGTAYSTKEEAVTAWAQDYYAGSRYTRYEFSSIIYSKTEKIKGKPVTSYYYTAGEHGGPHSTTVFKPNATATVKKERGTVVAGIHSHPIGRSFSDQDEIMTLGDTKINPGYSLYAVTRGYKPGEAIIKELTYDTKKKSYEVNDNVATTQINQLTDKEKKDLKRKFQPMWTSYLSRQKPTSSWYERDQNPNYAWPDENYYNMRDNKAPQKK